MKLLEKNREGTIMVLDNFWKTIQSLTDPIYVCDANGFISRYNRAAAELWGREPETGKELYCGSARILGKNGEEMRPEKYPIVQTLQYKVPVNNAEVVMLRKDGSTRRILQFTTPIYDVWGQLAGAVNRMVDITKN